jgi:hypothetical protein
MAVSAISSVSGGYARLLRTFPGDDSPAPEKRVAENAAPEAGAPASEESAPAIPLAAPEGARSERSNKSAVLDEVRLADGSKRLALEQERGARTLEVSLQIASLQARDAEVRRHEAAHIAAGDGYVIGGASYTYQIGPDGRQYAVGGQVDIDTSPIPGKPEETVRKMRVVRAAALSSGQPSSADLAVAAEAAQAEAAATAEIAVARVREFAARYSDEMSAARTVAPPLASGSSSSPLRDDGPPPTPFDVIA